METGRRPKKFKPGKRSDISHDCLALDVVVSRVLERREVQGKTENSKMHEEC